MNSNEESSNTLPPIINTNPRGKIDYEKISVNSIKALVKENLSLKTEFMRQSLGKCIETYPLYPLTITWSPENLYFEILEREVVKELWFWNTCSRTIYVHCCGLWDANETARLGAGWRCYPRTRFHIAPGLMSKLFIRAKPRSNSPVSFAVVRLQLAAAHMRDHITGFFFVPIHVKFLNYVPPNLEECK